MKILVTGGAGFIGSHCCDALLSRGDKVICLDTFNDYYDPKTKENNIEHNLDNENFSVQRIDIRDKEKLHNLFSVESKSEPIKKIIHLAARAGVRPSIDDPFLYEDVNIKGTLNLLDIAREFKIDNFVMASSSSVYGINKKVPFSESDFVDNPVSPYAATKKACELFAHTYHHLYGLNISCMRFFTVYGPRGRPDMAPFLFTKWIDEGNPITRFGDGSSKRDYTFIDDIVKGVIAALDANHSFEVFNIGNSDTVELSRLISTIENILGKKAEIIEKPMPSGDVPMTFADISKAEKLLKYKPTTSIEEGMKKFIDWYKQKNI